MRGLFPSIANQEREKAGLDNVQVHGTENVIKVAIEAIRELIKKDNGNK